MKVKTNYGIFRSWKCARVTKSAGNPFYFTLLLLFFLFTGSLFAQQKELSIDLTDVTIRSAITEIEKSSDYLFLLTDDVSSELNRKTSIHADRRSLQEILNEAFSDTWLAYNIVERQVSVYKNPAATAPPAVKPVAPARQQKKIITGTITDEQGEPIMAASVIEKGTTNGTVTDGDGRYSIQVAPDAVLLFDYLGFISQEVSTAGRTTIDIVLVEDTHIIDEVIVVAYGEQKRSAFTGSASVVSTDVISKRPVTNVMSALEGVTTGVQMEFGSGSMNATPSFRIRGVSSINAGNSPLIILDGVPFRGGWNNINPNDVESVTVLKDAASTAIYGARGGNGVILVTTKRVEADRDLKVNFDSRVAVSKVRQQDLYDVIESPGEYYELQYASLYNYYQDLFGYSSFNANRAANESWLKNADEGGLGYLVYTIPDGEYLIGHNGKLNPNATLGRRVTGTDGKTYFLTPDNWLDETYTTGLRQDYSLGVNGGTDKLRMRASVGYTNDQGITAAAFLERFTGRLKSVLNARKWLRITADLDISLSEYMNNTDYSDNSNNIFSNANRYAPIYPVYIRDENGDLAYDNNGVLYDYGDGTYNNSISRPINPGSNRLQEALIQPRGYSSNRVGSQFNTDFILTKHLTASFNVAYGERNQRHISLRQPFYGSSHPGGDVSVSSSKNTTLNLQQLINYSRRFDDHNIKLTLLHEFYSYNSYSLSGGRSNMFNYFGNQELAGAITMTSNSSGYSTYYSEGFGGRFMYDYLDKYHFDASYRRDASSRFHPDHRWGNFFSFGAAYLISRENFFNVSWIDELKLKASFGQNGNDNIGDHRYVDIYSLENVEGEIAVTFSNRGNKHITWETRTATNTGIEFTLFRGKLSGEIDFYNNKTTNMLASISVPYSLGYSSYYDNVGSMRNRGWEYLLRGEIIRVGDFAWNMYGTASFNKSKILQLADERKGETLYDIDGRPVAQGYSSGSKFYGEGQEYKVWYQKKFAGINDEGLPLWYVRDEDGTVSTTSVYSTATYFASGSSQPKVYGGFGGSFSWKSIELSYAFAYRLGGLGNDSGYATLMSGPYNGRTGYNFHKDVYKAWTPENPSNEFARWQYEDRYFTSSSDRWLTKADYLSFQNISLGYTIPQNVTRSLGIERLTVSAGVDNLLLLTHRKGFIPSRDFDGSVSFGYFPEMSRYMMSVSVNF